MTFILPPGTTHLLLPLWKSGSPCPVSITFPSGERTFLKAKAGDGKPDGFTAFPVTEGRLSIESDAKLLSHVESTQGYDHPKQKLAFHYRPSAGWINDPNGMVRHNGVYHLYHQYNPVGDEWGNMSWGHATSIDLVHWTEQDIVLLPDDEEHTIFSGSGIEEDGKLFFPYTRADSHGKAFTQNLAVSRDGGRSLEKQGVIIPTLSGDSRDPKVFHYKGGRYLLLWLREHVFGLFEGKSWHDWRLIEEIDAPPFWECPDIWFLGNTIAFTGAQGIYRLGTFDGLMHLEEEAHSLFLTPLPYASQSFSGIEGTTIISWLRTKSVPGVMSLPRRLVLGQDGIHAYPPEGFEKQFGKAREKTGTGLNFQENAPCRLCIKSEWPWSLTIGDSVFRYDPEDGTVSGDASCRFPAKTNEVEVLIDSPVLEMTDSACKSLAYFEIPQNEGNFRFESHGQTTVIVVPFKG